jgi:hypothetical protein
MRTLYHYTCDHAVDRIGVSGLLLPGALMAGLGDEFAWFTDLEVPIVPALGLTSVLLTCDRTAHRYRVVDDVDVLPWRNTRWTVDKLRRDAIEVPGTSPGNWFVSRRPVPVVLDERGAA